MLEVFNSDLLKKFWIGYNQVRTSKKIVKTKNSTKKIIFKQNVLQIKILLTFYAKILDRNFPSNL